jgi:endogenous inhibitor of DNA gyrase (YacG/DUF329 family)
MAEQRYVKKCPLCGKENEIYQVFCSSCGDGDLSQVAIESIDCNAVPLVAVITEEKDNVSDAPKPKEDITAKVGEVKKITLISVDDPTIEFTVKENQTIGRNEKADVIVAKVAKSEWISGKHALFTRRGQKWYIQHVGKTNYIIVDNEKFSEDEEVPIYNDSIIALSLSLFKVKIK